MDLRTTRPLTRSRASIRVLATGLLLALTATTLGATRTDAAPPTTDPVSAGRFGAHFLAGRVNAAGFVPTAAADPNYGKTLGVALALAQAGTEQPTFDRVVGWLQANTEAVIKNDDPAALPTPSDNPGNLGYLLMISKAAGLDPATFGGVDLRARLAATLGAREFGLFGADDPTYDGVFRQSLALLGLASAGIGGQSPASTWLLSQQCGAVPAAAAGAFESYRATPAVTPCTLVAAAPDYVAPDTNSTALAVQALRALGLGASNVTAALDWLAAQQTADGGFGYQFSPDPDPNSTALVIQAIVAGGEDPAAGRWNDGGRTPLTSLLSWQLGCDASAGERGGFTSPYSDGFADDLATLQAVWGVGGKSFPITGTVTFGANLDLCAAQVTTTSTSSSTSSTSTSTSTVVSTTTTTAVAPASPARPVAVAPAFAG